MQIKHKKMIHTHGNSENFGLISFVVVPVESFFPNGKGSLDCEGVVVFNCGSSKVSVNVIHGWYNGCDARRSSGKKQSRNFEDLTRPGEVVRKHKK